MPLKELKKRTIRKKPVSRVSRLTRTESGRAVRTMGYESIATLEARTQQLLDKIANDPLRIPVPNMNERGGQHSLLFVGGYEGRIETLRFDPRAKTLTRVAVHKDQTGLAPTWLELSANGQALYAVDEWGEHAGEVFSYKIKKDGSLESTGQVKTSGMWPCHSRVLPSGKGLLVPNYKGGIVSSIPLRPDGAIDDKGSAQEYDLNSLAATGPHPTRQDSSHPHGVHLTPDRRHVLVPDLGTDQLAAFAVQADDRLTPAGSTATEPGDGPRHCLFHQIGNSVMCYVLNELHNSVSVYRQDASRDGFSLVPVQKRVSLLPDKPFAHQSSFATWHAAELAIMHDGKRLIASNRSEDHAPEAPKAEAEDDILAIFDVDQEGRLSNRTLVSSHVRAPRHMSLKVLGDKEYLAVTGHDNDLLVIFELVGKNLIEIARLDCVGKPAVAVWK